LLNNNDLPLFRKIKLPAAGNKKPRKNSLTGTFTALAIRNQASMEMVFSSRSRNLVQPKPATVKTWSLRNKIERCRKRK
jgi:hypothetical protein